MIGNLFNALCCECMLILQVPAYYVISSMKAELAIWWPLKNKEIEQMVSYSSILQIFTSDNTKMKPLNFESE